MSKTITKNCLYCGTEFDAVLSEVKRGFGKFCKRSCSTSHRNKNLVPDRREEEIKWNRNIAYLTGLVTSDGTLFRNRKRLTITNADFELIEIARELIKNEVTGKTYKPVELTKDKSIWWNYQFTSYSYYDFLINIGLMPNKSLIIQDVQVPDEFLADFLRGVFDGDGNFSLLKENYYINMRIFSGSEIFLKNLYKRIQTVFKTEGGSVYKDGDIYTLGFYNDDTQKLLPHLYNNEEYALSRKKEIALPYMQRTRI